MPVRSSVLRPICVILVSMTKSRLYHIATDRTGLCGRLGRRRAGLVRSFVFFSTTYGTFVPMLVFITAPLSRIGMGDGARVTAGVARGVAGVRVSMYRFVLLYLAYRASMPMFATILRPLGLVGVDDSTSIAAGVAGGVASVRILMSCRTATGKSRRSLFTAGTAIVVYRGRGASCCGFSIGG